MKNNKGYLHKFGWNVLLMALLTLASCQGQQEQPNDEQDTLVNGKLAQLATGFTFTEGPAVDIDGNVYFSDIPQNSIYIWRTDETLDTFTSNSGMSNGLFFDRNENLLACERVQSGISIRTADGEKSFLAQTYDGKPFNQPNDLWPDQKGGVYFTDPKYGSDQEELSQNGMHVYYITPGEREVIRVCDDLGKPNGVIGSPDGKTLYVTDTRVGKTYQYDIQGDGTLINKSHYVDFSCDGMTIDTNGNVYLTAEGKRVEVYTPGGEFVEAIDIPERPTNVCFGGKDRNQLYITARTSLYRIDLNTTGVD